MAKTYVCNGTGTLYDVDEKETLATIAYRIYRNPATEQKREEWWGGFSLSAPLAELEEYLLELEDGRRGNCAVSLRSVSRLSESLIFYHYDIRGTAALK
jgi:hypothetical protein